MAKSKIYIKPSKRGTFTAAAKNRGKGVQAFASQVLANKENYSPAMVKKANFARNAAKWNKEMGGYIPQYQYGGLQPMQGLPIQPVTTGSPTMGLQPMMAQGVTQTATSGAAAANPALAISAAGNLASDLIMSGSSQTNVGAQTGAGAATGAATGAAVGSVVPVIGTAIGAGAGALLGGAAGFLKGKKAKREEEVAMDAKRQAAQKAYANTLDYTQVSNPFTPTFQNGGMLDQYACGGKKRMQEGGMMPNAEIEGGELIDVPVGEMPEVYQGGGLQQQSDDTFMAQGASHAQGGMDVNLPNNTRIFSDKLMKGDKTYADHASTVSKKLGKYEEMLADPTATKIQKNSAKRMISKLNSQLDSLFNEQEASKPNAGKQFNKFEDGGEYDWFNQPTYEATNQPTTYDIDPNQAANTSLDLTSLDQKPVVGTSEPGFLSKVGEKIGNVDYGTLLYKGAQVAPALYNIGRGMFEEAETYDPIYNPYEAEALTTLKGRKYNVEPELARNRLAAATSRRNLRTTSPSVGAYRSNLAAIQAAEARAEGETRAMAQNIQNQYAAEYAGALGQYGQQRAAAQALARQQTEQAKAAKERMLQTGLSQLSQFGQRQYADRLRFGALDDTLARYTYDKKTGKFKLK